VSRTSWQLWRNQICGVARIDLKRNFLTRRALWVYLIALAPVAIFGVGTLVRLKTHAQPTMEMDTRHFAATFQTFYLRFVVFFGCAGVFLNLFHGEVLDRSLHFYFLAPLRREVLLAGKYLSGLAAASAIFCLSVVLQFAALYGSHSSGMIPGRDGPRLRGLRQCVPVSRRAVPQRIASLDRCSGLGKLEWLSAAVVAKSERHLLFEVSLSRRGSNGGDKIRERRGFFLLRIQPRARSGLHRHLGVTDPQLRVASGREPAPSPDGD